MKKQPKKYALASWLAIAVGLAIVWVLICGIGGQLFRGLFNDGKEVRENLFVTLEGQVLIVRTTYLGGTEGRKEYRTLEGHVVEVESDQMDLYLSRLPSSPSSNAILERPLNWTERISATSDRDNPATYWFLVRDDSLTGSAYFVGYDSMTRRIVGYLSRAGFAETLPSQAEQFNLRGRVLGYSPPVGASTGYLEAPSLHSQFRYSFSTPDTQPRPWLLFLSDLDRIWKIDLREGTVETFDEINDVISMTMVYEPLPPPKDSEENGELTLEQSKKTVNRLALRREDKIDIWNLTTSEKQSFSIPEHFRDHNISALSLGKGELLIRRGYGPWGTDGWTDLAWLDTSEGEVRAESFQLQGWAVPNPRKEAWKMAGIMPVPAAWGFLNFVGTPFRYVNERKEPTYGSALARTWQETWTAFVSVLLISVIAAGIVWRWHRQAYQPGGALWSVLVFLLGLPGLVAYWLHFRDAPVSTCESCGKVVLRNRDSCAACAKPFPEPMLKGTEIFA